MKCIDARDAMLVADATELRGDGDTAIATHLRTCDVCKADARRILDNNVALDDHLDALTSKNDVRVARHTSHKSAAWYMRAAAVIACVGVAGTLLKQNMTSHTNEIRPLQFAERAPLSMPQVNAKAAGDVAVMRTANPSITVIWYLSPRRGKS